MGQTDFELIDDFKGSRDPALPGRIHSFMTVSPGPFRRAQGEGCDTKRIRRSLEPSDAIITKKRA